MKYRFIRQHRNCHSITMLCRVLGVSCRGYYDWLDRPESRRSQANRELLGEIWRIFIANREVYGAPRIHDALVERGCECGIKRVARLMQVANIFNRQRLHQTLGHKSPNEYEMMAVA